MKFWFLVTIICFLSWHCTKLAAVRTSDADAFKNVSEIITTNGYPLEEYTVQTDDGYLLSLLRIPHGRNDSIDEGEKKVVLLMHGEREDAKSFVLNRSNQSLGFLLPDAGYDVWLLNERGSDYSRNHVNYTTNQNSFWNFSLDEMMKYDAPATIDYILNATGKEALYVIGYSRGSSIIFAMLSEFPRYNEKVKLFIALAPIVFVSHAKNAMSYFVPYKDQLNYAYNLFFHGEFVKHKALEKSPSEFLCKLVGLELCDDIIFGLDIVDKAKLNEYAPNTLPRGELLPHSNLDKSLLRLFCEYADSGFCKNVILAMEGFSDSESNKHGESISSSTSIKSLVHFAQLHDSKKFRKYDYGRLRNLEYYHQAEPPDYDVSRITTPVALISSLNDIVAVPEDVDILRKQLKSLVFDYESPYPHSHGDFLAAENAPELLYKPVLELLAQY